MGQLWSPLGLSSVGHRCIAAGGARARTFPNLSSKFDPRGQHRRSFSTKMSQIQPLCIEANRAYQATRAYSTPPVFPEWDDRHTTSDYGLVHLAMTITKRPIFLAIIGYLLPSEAVLVLQCRKVFVEQVAVQAAVPSPPPASNLLYLKQLTKALAGKPPKGFRFAVTMAANKKAPRGLDKQIFDAADKGKLVKLIGLCQEWAGHKVIDAYKDESCKYALMIAADHGHEECIRVLIAAKADVLYTDRLQMTCLHRAAENGFASICRVLINEGASITALNRDRESPLDLANAYGHTECSAILEKAAAAVAVAMEGVV